MTYGRNLAGLMAKILDKALPDGGAVYTTEITARDPKFGDLHTWTVTAQFNQQRKRWEVLDVK